MSVTRYTCDDPDYDLWICTHGTYIKYDDYEKLEVAARKALAVLQMYHGVFKDDFMNEAVSSLKEVFGEK